MKYRLNKLPVKTTNNFNINDLEIELDLPQINKFKKFTMDGDISKIEIEVSEKKKKISSRIGLEFDKYLDVNITIPKNIKLQNTIIFNYDFINDDVLIDKINLIFLENSSANFIFIYKSHDNSKCFHHAFFKTVFNNNSQGNIALINMLNEESFHFVSLENDVHKSCNANFNIVDLGGKVKLSNCYTNILESSSNKLSHIYIGKNNDIIDINHYLKNTGKNSVNNMNVQGVISDKCIKNFRGTIDFISGCSDAIGEEIENCILLSDNARSRSLPQMLCEEENVIGTHGVSSGKVSEEKLFYLMSRGYSKRDAERLIVLANFSSIINNIENEDIRTLILNRIEELI